MVFCLCRLRTLHFVQVPFLGFLIAFFLGFPYYLFPEDLLVVLPPSGLTLPSNVYFRLYLKALIVN